MSAVGGLNFLLPPKDFLLSLTLVALLSFGYFVFFLVRNNLHQDIIRSVLVSMLIFVIGFIPIFGPIVVLGFVIYNISRAVDGLKSLIPDILTSIFVYGLLAARVVFDAHDDLYVMVLAGVYFLTVIAYCRTLDGLPTEQALFKMSVMWLSVPLAAMIIMSILSALGRIFRVFNTTVTSTRVLPQNVSAHMRGGVQIDAYTRNVTSTVTSNVIQVAPGSGVVAASVTGEVSKKMKEEQE